MYLKITETNGMVHRYRLNTELKTDVLEWVCDRMLRAHSNEAIVEFLTNDENKKELGDIWNQLY